MAGFYAMCREKCYPVLKLLGFKSYQNHYHRVVNGVIQRISFLKMGKYRFRLFFDFTPLCVPLFSRTCEGRWEADIYFTPCYYTEDGLSISYAEPWGKEYWEGEQAEKKRDEYWVEKYYKQITEIILPWFEMGNTPESAMYAMRYIRAHCPPNRREWPYGVEHQFPIHIQQHYFFLLQDRKYDEAEQLLRNYQVYYRTEYPKKYARYTMEEIIQLTDVKFVEEYLQKSREELAQMIEENEQRNLQELKWK